MPKLTNKNPKLGKLGKYAVVRIGGKTVYLKDLQGKNAEHGTPEALTAYNRFCVELQTNPTFLIPSGAQDVTIEELAAAYLEHYEATKSKEDYRQIRMIIKVFLLPLYGGECTLVTDFSPKALKLVREKMVQSERFNREWCNRYTRNIVTMFRWGVEEELVPPSVSLALKEVKPLPAKYPGTFEGTKRKPVADDVVVRTIKYGVPTEVAMIKVHRLTGARSGEICNLTVGAVNLKDGTILLTEHKTKAYIGERTISLRPEAREIIAPFLIGKKPENAVFSPRTAMEERNAEKRANRKSKITPSQEERNRQRAEKPKKTIKEFYDSQSYCQMVKHLIAKANKAIKKENESGRNILQESIPHWTPYQLRHATATADAMSSILKMAMERLGHTDTRMTENYAHVKNVLENMLAMTQDNPFNTSGVDHGKESA